MTPGQAIPHHRQKCGACGFRAGEHSRRIGSIQGVCSGFQPLKDAPDFLEDRSRQAEAVDRALKATADVSSSYDTDARAVARVLLRHYGDEAEAIVDRLPTFLVHARLEKRR